MICTFWTPFQAERDWQNYKIHTEELSKFHSNLFSLEIGLFTLHSAQLLCLMFIELPWDSTVAIKSFSYSRTFLFSLYFLQLSSCLCSSTFPLLEGSILLTITKCNLKIQSSKWRIKDVNRVGSRDAENLRFKHGV